MGDGKARSKKHKKLLCARGMRGFLYQIFPTMKLVN